MAKKEISFRRKLMASALCVTIPLIVLLFVSNFYSIYVFNGKIADSNMRAMNYRAERIEDGLESVDDFLTGVMAASAEFRTLSGSTSALNNISLDNTYQAFVGIGIYKDFKIHHIAQLFITQSKDSLNDNHFARFNVDCFGLARTSEIRISWLFDTFSLF